MKKALIFAAVAEATTGLALLVVPSLVGQLLLGQEFAGVTIPVARVTGIALVGLGIACWPGPPLAGMLIYSVAVTLYLAYVGFAGGFVGVLLWPPSPFTARCQFFSRAVGSRAKRWKGSAGVSACVHGGPWCPPATQRRGCRRKAAMPGRGSAVPSNAPANTNSNAMISAAIKVSL